MDNHIRSYTRKVYLTTYVVFHTGVMLEFFHLAQQAALVETLVDTLDAMAPTADWHNQIQQYRRSSYVDETTQPKMTDIISADIGKLVNETEINIPVDSLTMTCQISQPKIYLFPFNMGLLEFTVSVPEATWQDPKALKKIIAFINKGFNGPQHWTSQPWTNQFVGVLQQLVDTFHQAVTATNMPLLKTPYVDLQTFLAESHVLQGSHVALVGIYDGSADINAEHLQDAMLQVAPGGVKNLAESKEIYAFTESHDSLFVYASDEEDLSAIEQQLHEKWLLWVRFHEFSWKLQWELDKVLSAIINATTIQLKISHFHLTTEDIYQINAFLKYMWLCLDSHQPRNLSNYTVGTQTLLVDVNHYMHTARINWQTDVIASEGYKKMDTLEKFIHQMYEFSRIEQTRAMEKFLALLGVFGLGSFFVSYLTSIDITQQWGDLIYTGLLVVILALFTYVLFRIIR